MLHGRSCGGASLSTFSPRMIPTKMPPRIKEITDMKETDDLFAQRLQLMVANPRESPGGRAVLLMANELLPHHLEHLRASAIGDEVIQARGYHSIKSVEARNLCQQQPSEDSRWQKLANTWVGYQGQRCIGYWGKVRSIHTTWVSGDISHERALTALSTAGWASGLRWRV